tara:strand:+ start:2869 stop:3234 length:366 start_codon:yes stop_codon:yes gene_type:complete
MAHYAFLNMSNIVTEVIVGKDETDGNLNWELYYQSLKFQICKRTSYNTIAGTHKLGGTPFRKNYAGIGYTYDQNRDAFIPPKPHNSWVLNENTCNWGAPVPYPSDGKDYVWNEETTNWVLN